MSGSYKMNGQWIGAFTGTTAGRIHVNIDEAESNYVGVAYLFQDDPKLPPVVAFFVTPNKDEVFSFRTDPLQAIDVATSGHVPWDKVKGKYPEGTVFSNYADVRGSVDATNLTLSWTTDLGVIGTCVLPRSKADQPSELVALEQDWGSYKEFGIRRATERPLFRGQNKPWRLRTPFHRFGRADMNRFASVDVPALHRNLSARTKHVFKLDNQEEYGAFINLVQHHGYPTPVLDGTYSPYVAAFFAYRSITNVQAASASSETKVRIFVFDSSAWTRKFESLFLIAHPKLHVTVRELHGIDNERMIPQQAASTLSSVDDIETYIRDRESDTTKFIQAIDLPLRERKHVMRELSYMGITAGSLCPGLDGACQELAERFFEF